MMLLQLFVAFNSTNLTLASYW